MHNEFIKLPQNQISMYHLSDVMNTLIDASDMERTGWYKHNLTCRENVAKYMLDCVVISNFICQINMKMKALAKMTL